MSSKRKPKGPRKAASTKELLKRMKTRKRRRQYYFLFALALIVVVIAIGIAATRNALQPQPTSSQQTGNLMVHVTDANGIPILGATITISGPIIQSAVAEEGVKVFQSIPTGIYMVTANATGYNQESTTAQVIVGQTSHSTVTLNPS